MRQARSTGNENDNNGAPDGVRHNMQARPRALSAI